MIEETEETSEREAYWIDKLRTYVGFPDCNGYNATMGGDGKKYINLDEEEIIQYHLNEAQMIVRYTANHFKADRKTIKNILIKHNIKWLSGTEIKQKVAMEKHGYIYMVD